MKKLKYIELIVEILVVLLFAICMIAVPVEKSLIYWVSFGFTIIAGIIYFLILRYSTDRKKDAFLYMVMPVIGFVITCLQVSWNLFVLGTEFIRLEILFKAQGASAFEGTWFQEVPLKKMITIFSTITDIDLGGIKVVDISMSTNVIVNLLLIILYISIFYFMYAGIKDIEEKRNSERENTVFIRTLRTDVAVLKTRKYLNGSLKDGFNELEEKLKYCDPISNDITVMVEWDIQQKMDALKENLSNGNEESALALISEISEKIEERNIHCKRGKV